MRGKLRYRHYPLLVARIIPAHAGQTCCRRRPSRSRPDHPRACGANNFEESKPLPAIGSSPRMRGKPSTRGLQGTRRRIIPAHAGQTTSGLPGSVTSSDHPRACGANVEMHASLGSHVGSSPRMRGKLRQQLHVPELFRIIPAHAGQTVSIVPRSFASRFAGSSPRMRGKLTTTGTIALLKLIIPAHAGQTPSRRPSTGPAPDHPRACGANYANHFVSCTISGSSPRMRGKRAGRLA